MATFDPQVSRREVPIADPSQACIIYIDVQNASLDPKGIFFERSPYFDEVSPKFIANLSRLQQACRAKKVENIYVVIESLTKDGRDRSLDYKISGFNIPKGSFDAQVFDAIKPADDEIVIPKTSCDVFMSTNVDYILRNLGKRQVILVGMLSDQCVSSAIRSACDLGYLVTMVTDACLTRSNERHEASVNALKGFCRQRTTQELVNELEKI